MTDIRADDATSLDRDDRLPWLEAVDEDDQGGGPSALKLIVAVLIGLVAIGALVGGAFWIANRSNDNGGSGEAELIRAPAGDYKAKPPTPGGMTVEGEGDTAFAASAGADPKGQINTAAVPETPVTANAPAPQPQPVQAPPAKAPQPVPAKAPAAAAPQAAPAGPGGTIQLGAFSSQANAEQAWKAMAGRFTYLAPLSHSVVAVPGAKTLYRLRASGGGASGICGRLRVAGESCVAVD